MPIAAGLAVLFLVVPILEIFVIVQVGQEIGAWPTVFLLLAESALGAWLVRREGKRAWRALRSEMRASALPGRELLDSALILIGGTLLLTPGFLTDVVGFALVLPFTRPIARRIALLFFASRFRGAAIWLPLVGLHGRRTRSRRPQTIEGEVIDEGSWPGDQGDDRGNLPGAR